ncbi:MAG: hypothetical protein K0S93_577 [Nitrososphaeraceae archaeon]|jgi:hypothetical protein|nr:hypothetical protein [Nitrososphaeraceae archaeon]
MSSCSYDKLNLHSILEFMKFSECISVTLCKLGTNPFCFYLFSDNSTLPMIIYINFLYILIFNNQSYFSIITKKLNFSLKLIIYLNT